MVLFPLGDIRKDLFPNGKFIINRPEKWGGKIYYNNYEEVEVAFKNLSLSPEDLKLGVVDLLENLVKPIRESFKTKELQELIKKAYPLSQKKE